MLGLYFLEEVMAIVRRRWKVPQIRSIKATVKVKASENSKPEVTEINWANSQYREDLCKDADKQLGFSIVSKRYDEV